LYGLSDNMQHSQRKRELADRYAMTNILREEHVLAIKNRAKAFVSRFVASAKSVDVYVRLLHLSPFGSLVILIIPPGLAPLLRP
jgi:hypothetical protein